MVIAFEQHRRPPADSLFCRTGDACDRSPAISMKEQDDFAGLFADSFAVAMTEAREDAARRARKRERDAA